MISKKLRKMGEARGFVTSNGICYGDVNGYTITLDENSSYKNVVITAGIDQTAYQNIMANEKQIRDTYRILLHVQPTFVVAQFAGLGAKPEKISAFIDAFTAQMDSFGCKKSACNCLFCGMEMESTSRITKLVGGRAIRMHSGCAERLIDDMKTEEQAAAEQKSNAGKGLLGAVLLGLAAAIPWAIVYALGYFVAWLGALIGMGVVKGYQKFGGVVKKSTIVIFAVLIILLVVFAQLLGDVFQIGYTILQGEVWGTLADIPFYLNMLFSSSEYISDFLFNVLLGVIFAGLGVYGIFRTLISGVSSQSKKVVDLPDNGQ